MASPGPPYGPPPDAEQVLLAAGPLDLPWAWALCIAAGLGLAVAGLALRERSQPGAVALVCCGHVLALTAPLGALLERSVFGAWPTVDKAGSYLFYMDGVHLRPLLEPASALSDPALRLIGLHLGHLWVTHLLDLALSAHGAFNAQGLLYPALAWFCAWLLFREAGARSWPAFLAAWPFAMGLHVFRDLQWFTIEKAAVFGIPLFCWTLLRARRRGGWWLLACAAALLGSAWLNWYLALVNGAVVALWLLAAHDKGALRVAGAALAALAPFVALQALLLHDAGAMGDPQRFLWQRAALDVLSVYPPRWNHLELWRALNLPLLVLGLWGFWRCRAEPLARFAALMALALGALSLGPMLLGRPEGGLPNPVFWAAWKTVPGFWRVAKPEFFFEATYLALLGAAARALSDQCRRRAALGALHVALAAGWIAGVRSHPAYPVFTEPVPVSLSPHWERSVFGD